jgi:hypothetical protein
MQILKFIFISLILSSCIVPRGEIVVQIKTAPVSVNHIDLANHQFKISGSHLENVTSLKIKEGNTYTNLEIESKTSGLLISNTLNNVTFAAGKVFEFILSTSNASTTYTVNFSLCDSALNGVGFNCIVTPHDKDVLSYDGNTNKWIPRQINGLAYQGTFSAAGGVDPAGPSTAADYYIISTPGSIGGVSYAIGDWITYNGSSWEKISNGNAVAAVFGRTGNVVAVKGDYDLNKLLDVDLTTAAPVNGNVLQFNGTKWVPAVVSGGGGGGGSGTVTSVTGTLPISVASGTSTPVVSIATAASGVAGALSSTAFDTFNNKLGSTLTSGNIFVGNGSNVATGTAMSGDVTISNAGVTAIGAGKITNAMLAGSIALTSKVTGSLPIANGGTAGTTAAEARANLGLVIGSGAGELMTFTTGMSCFPYEKLQVSSAPYILSCVTDNANTNYALLAGRSGGQVLNGSTVASENLTLESTANATKGFVLINPTGGNVGIGTTTPTSGLNVKNGSIVTDTVINTVAYINYGKGNVQVSSTTATTINICGLKDGGTFTLVLTSIPENSVVTVNSYPTYVSTSSCSGTQMQMDLGAGSTTFTTIGNVTVLSFVYISSLGANGVVYGMPATNYNYR